MIKNNIFIGNTTLIIIYDTVPIFWSWESCLLKLLFEISLRFDRIASVLPSILPDFFGYFFSKYTCKAFSMIFIYSSIFISCPDTCPVRPSPWKSDEIISFSILILYLINSVQFGFNFSWHLSIWIDQNQNHQQWTNIFILLVQLVNSIPHFEHSWKWLLYKVNFYKAYSRRSFGPNSAWGSIETATIGRTRFTLQGETEALGLSLAVQDCLRLSRNVLGYTGLSGSDSLGLYKTAPDCLALLRMEQM